MNESRWYSISMRLVGVSEPYDGWTGAGSRPLIGPVTWSVGSEIVDI